MARFFYILLVMAILNEASKKELLKTSEDSGFCVRNRYLTRNRAQIKNSGLRFDMDYEVDSTSIQKIPGGISFLVKSIFEDVPFLKGSIVLLTSGSLHVNFDEIHPLFPRFRSPYDDILNSESLHEVPDDSVKVKPNQVIWTYGKQKYELNFSPITIQGYYDETLTLKVNSHSMMNFDRYRSRDADLKPASQVKDTSSPIKILDSAGVYLEKGGELAYFDDLWSETFIDFVDNKKRGPSSVAMDFAFVDATDVYGLPEHADHISLKDTVDDEPYRIYNIDYTEHAVDTRQSLYGNIPFMLSRSSKKIAGGVFWFNPSETYVDISTSNKEKLTHWISESGVIDFFLIVSETPMNVVETYTMLTGPPQLPPQFALGYHQCRWNYISQEDLLDVSSGFETNNLPMDVIWLDIEYTPERQYFMWDHNTFPDPIGMQNTLDTQNRKLVTIIDPHIKRSDKYSVHCEAEDLDLYVKNEDGEDFVGLCWPGRSSWLDFTKKDAQEYWAEHYSLERFPGSTNNTYIWNDMNEPSVFTGPEGTMPKTSLHGDVEHRDVHNLYGLLMMMSTHRGLLERSGNTERPFVLTRSFFAGVQKYGAIWTGDNTAKWEYLEYSIPMCLSVALGGVSMCGADIGGFFGDPEPELLVRWYQLAAFLPFFRGHSSIESKRREPWLSGEPYLSQIRQSLRLRYAMLPYWYTLFFQYHRNGTPVIRPMFLEFPMDKKTAKIDNQFLLGPSIMVAAVIQAGQEKVEIYLPEGKWYDYHTYSQVDYGEIYYEVQENWVPAFLRGGHIVPRQDRERNSSVLKYLDPFTLIVALDENEEAAGNLYIDDTKTHNYQSGEFLYAEMKFKDQKLKYEVANAMELENQIEKIVIVGMQKTPQHVLIENKHGATAAEFSMKENAVVIKLSEVQVNEHWVLTIN
ncbi:unnamed protein product [Blepharisma stoltei]|uniref:Glucosidase II subunit alpha n=1 Tax=Blepharisma stoltei TaxID=1481888 RepID=A0AAU9K1S3_9CILI|nr:unnamed protein product [Blepharisma stoltei]